MFWSNPKLSQLNPKILFLLQLETKLVYNIKPRPSQTCTTSNPGHPKSIHQTQAIPKVYNIKPRPSQKYTTSNPGHPKSIQHQTQAIPKVFAPKLKPK